MRDSRVYGRFTSDLNVAGVDQPSPVVLRADVAEVPDVVSQVLRGNTPLRLDDPTTLWVVSRGEIDLFYIQDGAAQDHASRYYVGTLLPGEVALGADPLPTTNGAGVMIAVGFGGAEVRSVPVAEIDEGGLERFHIARALATGVVETVGRAMHRVSRAAAQPLQVSATPVPLTAGTQVSAEAGVVWVRAAPGTFRFGDESDWPQQPPLVPLARGMWLSVVPESVDVAVINTIAAFGEESPSIAVAETWRAFLEWVARGAAAASIADADRLARKLDSERTSHHRALSSLASLLQAPDALAGDAVAPGGDRLFDACRAVGSAAGIVFRPPPGWEGAGESATTRDRDRVAAICNATRVRFRRVGLRGAWWHADGGPLLAFLAQGQVPVALLPAGKSGYVLHNPAVDRSVPVDEAVAATLEPFGFTFYRAAPDRGLNFRVLMGMVITDLWHDLRRVVVLLVIGSTLGLATPLVMGRMFNDVVPSAQVLNAITLTAALIAVAIGSASFELSRALAMIRIEGRSNSVLQAAIVDRLLRLPAEFFRHHTVGDLSMRANAVNASRQLLTGAAVTAVVGLAVMTVSIGLMTSYSVKLALLAMVVIASIATMTVLTGVYTLRYERRRQTAQGKIGSLVFEMLGGIAKLHVAAAEPRIFAIWSAQFRDLKVLGYRAGLGAAVLAVFNDMVPIVSSAMLFILAAQLFAVPGTLATGDFIAFSSAFGAALMAGTGVSNTLVGLMNVVPLLERATPILVATPEVEDAQPDPGLISGRIEAVNLGFGYIADAPPILNDVSFLIRPGEFVAFVGPSGAGKSTVLRLLLGFEQPNRGAVYYDGKDVANIDVSAIRRQAAVVLQQSRVLAGDIFTNIVGASPFTVEDAWNAAEMAGLADDIRKMPMGMHTIVSEGASTLSGGQRQRLIIARALVRRPRVVFFDEATSALDNRTQEIVTKSLETIRATRIVIAHRLTTIQRADRIFVMTAGSIVQQGRYEELMAEDGVFRQLAVRQIV